MAFLEIKSLNKKINTKHSLEVSALIEAGEIVAIKGPSGSGKSTLLKILTRLIPCDSGSVLFKSVDWREIQAMEWRRKVHYLPQKPVIFDLSVEQNLQLPFTLKILSEQIDYDREKVLEYLSKFNLSSDILSQRALSLSGGEAARVALIRAISIEPNILLLDEPSAYLDLENAKLLNSFLKIWVKEQAERVILIVSHKEEDHLELDISKKIIL